MRSSASCACINDNRYKQIEKEGIPASATTDEANALLTEMSTIKSSLDKAESYKMSNTRHSHLSLIHI